MTQTTDLCCKCSKPFDRLECRMQEGNGPSQFHIYCAMAEMPMFAHHIARMKAMGIWLWLLKMPINLSK